MMAKWQICNLQRKCLKDYSNELEFNRWNVYNVKIFTFSKDEILWWRERCLSHFSKRDINIEHLEFIGFIALVYVTNIFG